MLDNVGGRGFVEKVVLNFILREGEASLCELAQLLGLPPRLVVSVIREMEKEGLLEKEEEDVDDTGGMSGA